MRTKVLSLTLILAGFAIEPSARAQPARRWVEVVVIGSEDDAHSLDRSLRELLNRLEIDLDYRHVDHVNESSFAVPAEPPPLTIVTVDLDSDPVTITFRDARNGKPLGKREVSRNTAPNVTVETVAQIVQVGVEDITAAAAAAPPAHSPAPVMSPPSEKKPEPSLPAARPIATFAAPPTREGLSKETAATTKGHGVPWGFDFGAFADGSYVAPNTGLVVGGGALATFALWRGPWRPALTVSGSYHAAFDASDAFVDQRVKLLSVRAVPTIQLAGSNAWSLEAGAGVGADVLFTSQASTSVPSQFLRGARTDVDPIVLASATFHVSIASGSDLFLTFALPLDLAPHRYLDDVGGTTQTVFLPARVRPLLAFGFELTSIGKAAYSPALATNGSEK